MLLLVSASGSLKPASLAGEFVAVSLTVAARTTKQTNQIINNVRTAQNLRKVPATSLGLMKENKIKF